MPNPFAAEPADTNAAPQTPQAAPPPASGSFGGSGADQMPGTPAAVANPGDLQTNSLMGLVAPPAKPLSHEQVSASLTYFHRVQDAMRELLDDPKLGESSVRTKLFEVCADLLGEGFVTMPQIMNQIKTFPPDPQDQKKWIEKRLANAQMAQQKVLAELSIQGMAGGGMGLGTFSDEIGKMKQSQPHHAIMNDVMTHFTRPRR